MDSAIRVLIIVGASVHRLARHIPSPDEDELEEVNGGL